MAYDYAASIAGVALRITRLNSDGTCATGPSASYVSTGSFLSLAFTPEIEEGDEISIKNASGIVCTTYKQPDTLKRVTLELSICDPNPELTEMMTGGTILTSAGSTAGYAAPLSGVDPNPNGCAVEVWTRAIVAGKQASVNPYFHFVFPYAHLTSSGDRTVENGAMANSFSGWAVGNAPFGDGPANDWPFISDRPYQYARTATAPTSVTGYVAVTA